MKEYLLTIFSVLTAIVFTGTVSAQERNASSVISSDYEVSLSEGELFLGVGLPYHTQRSQFYRVGYRIGDRRLAQKE